jgi:hypothetical protein
MAYPLIIVRAKIANSIPNVTAKTNANNTINHQMKNPTHLVPVQLIFLHNMSDKLSLLKMHLSAHSWKARVLYEYIFLAQIEEKIELN